MPADTYTQTKVTAPPKRRRTFVTTIRVGGESRLGPRPERERLVVGFSR